MKIVSKTNNASKELCFTEEDLSNYLKDLEHIVNIDSPSNYKEGIAEVASYFEAKAKELNLNLHTEYRLYNEESGPCLVISNTDGIKDTEKLDFLLLAHIDTVFEVGAAKECPYTLNSDGIAYGCGVVDNKAGALMGLYAFKKFDLENSKIALLLNTNEEVGSMENSKLIEELAEKSKYVIVLEPARLDGSFVDKRYGTANYKVTFKGEKSPDVDFSKGKSALVEASHFIRYLHTFNHLFKNTILNFTIKAPESPHLGEVVDNVVVGLQIKYTNKESLNSILEKINSTIEKKIIKEVEITLEELSNYPCLSHEDNTKILKKEIWLAGKKIGYDVQWTSSFGGSDGCFASNTNKSVVDAIGPLGGNFHTKEEYLDTNTIPNLYTILVNAVNSIISKQKKEEEKANDESK